MPTPNLQQLSAKADAMAIFVTSLLNELIERHMLDREVLEAVHAKVMHTGAKLDTSTKTDEQVVNARRRAELTALFSACSVPMPKP